MGNNDHSRYGRRLFGTEHKSVLFTVVSIMLVLNRVGVGLTKSTINPIIPQLPFPNGSASCDVDRETSMASSGMEILTDENVSLNKTQPHLYLLITDYVKSQVLF